MIRICADSIFLTVLGIVIEASATHPAEAQMATLDVIMFDCRFVPDHLTFKRDVHYRVHLENHGKETHELTAPTFFVTADIDNPDVLNRGRSEILMQPGETKEVFLTAHKPGTYDLRCADHDWNGMVGGITVE